MGLTRIRGRCRALEVAATLKRTLQKRTLQMYSIDIDRNVFSLTTDGASVMKKLGEEDIKTEPFHLLCKARGLHLAVTELYNYKRKSNELVEIFKYLASNSWHKIQNN